MIPSSNLAYHLQSRAPETARGTHRLFIESAAAPKNFSVDLEAERLKRDDAELDSRLDALAEKIGEA